MRLESYPPQLAREVAINTRDARRWAANAMTLSTPSVQLARRLQRACRQDNHLQARMQSAPNKKYFLRNEGRNPTEDSRPEPAGREFPGGRIFLLAKCL